MKLIKNGLYLGFQSSPTSETEFEYSTISVSFYGDKVSFFSGYERRLVYNGLISETFNASNVAFNQTTLLAFLATFEAESSGDAENAKYIQTNDVSIVVNSNTALPLSGNGNNVIPAGSSVIGDTYKFELGAIVTSDNATDLTIEINVAGAIIGITTLPVVIGEQLLSIDYLFTIRSLGVTGGVRGYGRGFIESGMYPFDSAAFPTVNTAVNNTISVRTEFLAGNNQINVTNYVITKLSITPPPAPPPIDEF